MNQSVFHGKITAWSVEDHQGQPCLLEGFIEDMTPFVEARLALERESDFQKTLARVASRFINTSDFDEGLRLGMSDVGRVSGVSRVSIFFSNLGTQTFSQTHEWCAPGIVSQQDMFHDLETADFPWLRDKLMKGESVHIPEAGALPGEAAIEQAILKKNGIRSCLICPLYIDQRLMGCIAFEDIQRTGAWQAEYHDLLGLFAQMVGTACARKELEETLRQTEKMEAIGTLAGGIVHDFNNILAAVQNLTLLVLEDVPDDSQVARDLQQVLLASDKDKDLVGQKLSFSRKEGAQKEVLTFSCLVEESVNLVRPSLPAFIDLDLNISDAHSQVEADPVDIQKVIINLCTNARDALEQNTGRIAVTLEQRDIEMHDVPGHLHLKPGPYAFLEISDTGTGVPEALRLKIFDPFYTTKPKDKRTGQGYHDKDPAAAGLHRTDRGQRPAGFAALSVVPAADRPGPHGFDHA